MTQSSAAACGAPGPDEHPTMADRGWLAVACRLAAECPPSPTTLAAGAVVVAADGTELARAHSHESSRAHAEETALGMLAATETRLSGATVYSSLAPCARRPEDTRPCAELIRDAGVRRLVTALRDPGGSVSGGDGAGLLEAVGVTVIELPEYADAAMKPNRHTP
ncbi:CMP/dCMP-type deaminase domain-containing protein OS=Streptomyces alboniger OX=132473 GN=CP975_03455 PE=4 SV=1 [Streptomyces alboniger]